MLSCRPETSPPHRYFVGQLDLTADTLSTGKPWQFCPPAAIPSFVSKAAYVVFAQRIHFQRRKNTAYSEYRGPTMGAIPVGHRVCRSKPECEIDEPAVANAVGGESVGVLSMRWRFAIALR